MKLLAYTMTFEDEVDVLLNPVVSMQKVVDEHIVFDGGDSAVHHCYNPRDDLQPLKEFCSEAGVTYVSMPVERDFKPGRQRNRVLDWIEEAHPDVDWIVQIDSDEAVEFPYHTREAWEYPLRSMSSDIVTIAPFMYWLIEDETKFSMRLSNILDHGRIHRPGIHWSPTWHEHQSYGKEDGKKRLALPSMAWFHFRVLFVNRLVRQKGHGPEGWPGPLMIRDLPAGVVCPPIHWPSEEGRG